MNFYQKQFFLALKKWVPIVSISISLSLFAFLYNWHNQITEYEDSYYLYFIDDVYFITENLQKRYVRDTLNFAESNFDSFDESKNIIKIKSNIELADLKKEINDHSLIIFQDFLKTNGLISPIKNIKKVSKTNMFIKNELNIFFIFLMGITATILINFVRNIIKEIE